MQTFETVILGDFPSLKANSRIGPDRPIRFGMNYG
jgi:hypothetical protein